MTPEPAVLLYGDSMLGRFTKPRIANLEDAVDRPVLVLNGAAGGWDSTDCARRASVLAQCAPAVVVLSLGANDCASGRQVPLDTFVRNLATVRAAFAGSGLVAFLPPTVRETDVLGDPVALPRRRNVVLDSYRDALRDAAGTHRSLDVPQTLARHPETDPLEDDGLHLTAQAYDLLIPELAQVVAAALTDRGARP